ncbi:MAG: lipase [Frankiales bacterium]|jgi:lysophospholipase L1-like esterase|nr:lipase [Frankiales bacterium]
MRPADGYRRVREDKAVGAEGLGRPHQPEGQLVAVAGLARHARYIDLRRGRVRARPEVVAAPVRRGRLVIAGWSLALVAGCAAEAEPSAAPSPDAQWRPVAVQAMSKAKTTVTDTTCHEVVRVGGPGSEVRLRLSNAMSATPLRLASVAVRLRGGTSRQVTGELLVPAGEDVLTPPVPLPVRRGQDLVVDLAVRGTAVLSEHTEGAATSRCDGLPPSRAGLVVDRVDVRAPAAPPGVLVVGDSLTDPKVLAPDRYARWTDVLSARLPDRPVVNAAIDGNRLLAPGGYGPSATERFDRDVLRSPGVGTLLLLVGTNDIPGGLTANEITAALDGLVDRARRRGIRPVLLTLLPAGRRAPAYEQVRVQVNQWIRDAKEQVVDAEAVVRDPAQPTRLLPAYDHGDGLHLSEAGHRALGAAVAAAIA